LKNVIKGARSVDLPELDEIMELSDQIAVMYRGKIAAILPANQTTKENIAY